MNGTIEQKSFLFSIRIVKLGRYLQEEKKELLESLELYFKVFFMGEDPGKLIVPGY